MLLLFAAADDCRLSTAGENVALGKPAIQVSQWGDGHAELSVDGNKNKVFEAGSCSTTNHGPLSWWSVDLQKTYSIKIVTVTNRGDNSKYERECQDD